MQGSLPHALPGRLPFLDLVRVVASHLIVLHHLAYHGPLTELIEQALPGAVDAVLSRVGMAVQAFLVLGGFAAARGMERRRPDTLAGAGRTSWRRYKRLAVPYAAALALAVACNELARALYPHPSISSPATVPLVAAHLLFLQDVLGLESLTTGVWYLAVDFQLGVVTLVLAWAAQRLRVNAHAVMAGLALLALGVFNRADLEHWAIYFYASYFLGILAHGVLSGAVAAPWGWACTLLVGAVGAGDDRPRLVVAAVVAATVLLLGARPWAGGRIVHYLARISYGVFLLHFPVCLVAYAVAARTWALTPAEALAVMAVTYPLSLGVASAFHHLVEQRLVRLVRGPEPGAATAGEPAAV